MASSSRKATTRKASRARVGRSKKSGKATGRPTKLTQGVAVRIVQAVRTGAPRHVAAAAGGVSRSTMQTWLARGETVDAPALYRAFAEAVRVADAEAELDAITTIRDAADDDWRAAAFLLERKYPDRWGRQTRHEVTGPDGGPLEVDGTVGTWNLSALTEDELAALQEIAEKAGAG